MFSVFKIWAAANVQTSWTQDMENFVASQHPQNHEDLEEAIRKYQELQHNSKKRR